MRSLKISGSLHPYYLGKLRMSNFTIQSLKLKKVVSHLIEFLPAALETPCFVVSHFIENIMRR